MDCGFWARSKKRYAVDSVGKHKDKVWHKEAVNSFLTKLPLRASVECMEGRHSREEEEHQHLTDVHEASPASKNLSKGAEIYQLPLLEYATDV